jgi:hypothetical protein
MTPFFSSQRAEACKTWQRIISYSKDREVKADKNAI